MKQKIHEIEKKSTIKLTFLSLRLQSLPLVNKEKERDEIL